MKYSRFIIACLAFILSFSIAGSGERPEPVHTPPVSPDIIERPYEEFKREIPEANVEDLNFIATTINHEITDAERRNDISRVADLTNKIDLVQNEIKNRVGEAPPVKQEEQPITIPIERIPYEPAISSEQKARENNMTKDLSLLPRPATAEALNNRLKDVKKELDNLNKGLLPDGTSVVLTAYEKARLISIMADYFDMNSGSEGSLSAMVTDRFAADARRLGRWAVGYLPVASAVAIEKPWDELRKEGLGMLKDALKKAVVQGLIQIADNPHIRYQQLKDYERFVYRFALDDASQSMTKDIKFRLDHTALVYNVTLYLNEAQTIWQTIMAEDPVSKLILGTDQRSSLRKRLALKGPLTEAENKFIAQMDSDMVQAAKNLVSFISDSVVRMEAYDNAKVKYQELEGLYRILENIDANMSNFSPAEKLAFGQLQTLEKRVAKLRLDVLLDPTLFVENWRDKDEKNNKISLFTELSGSILYFYDYQKEINVEQRKSMMETQQALLSKLLKAAAADPEVRKAIAAQDAEIYQYVSFRRDELAAFLSNPPKMSDLALDKEYQLYSLIPQDQLTLLQKIYREAEARKSNNFLDTLKQVVDVFNSQRYRQNLLLYPEGRAMATLVTMQIAFEDPFVLKKLIAWAQDSQLKASLSKFLSSDSVKEKAGLTKVLKAQAGLLTNAELLSEADVGRFSSSIAATCLYSLSSYLQYGAGFTGVLSVVALIPGMGGAEQSFKLGSYTAALAFSSTIASRLAEKFATLDIDQLKQLVATGKPLSVIEKIARIVATARQAGITFKDKAHTVIANWLTSLRYGVDSLKARLPRTAASFKAARSDYLSFLGLNPQQEPTDATLRLAIERKKREIASSVDVIKQEKEQKKFDTLGQAFIKAQKDYVTTYQEYLGVVVNNIVDFHIQVQGDNAVPATFKDSNAAVDWINNKLVLLADLGQEVSTISPELGAILRDTPLENLENNIMSMLENVTSLYQQADVKGIEDSIDAMIKANG